jgi:MinD-like ATPase involved in chromosome partitioning or flagellar assembly
MSANYEPSDSSYDRFFPQASPGGEQPGGYGGDPHPPRWRVRPGGPAHSQSPVMHQQPPGFNTRQNQGAPCDPRLQSQPLQQPAPGPNVVPWPRSPQQSQQPFAQTPEHSYAQSPNPAHSQPPVAEPAATPDPRAQFWAPDTHAAAVTPPQQRQSSSASAEQQQVAPPVQQQMTQTLPDWMVDPVDNQRFVDHRVGDDEQSLTYSADRLDLVRARKIPPGQGWRKLLYLLTFHQLNLGLSPAEVAYAEMMATIRQPITGDYKIGVVSLKGGVGKTTTTVCLGSTFAKLRRGDRVVALDGNPDFGTLVNRVAKQTNTTVKDLLADENLKRYGDVRRHTSQNIHGLEVVAGERDLAQSERFSKAEFERVMAVLEQHYSLIFTDCGTGVINEAMDGVLDTSNGLIFVSSVTIDGARAVSANIEWLQLHGYQHLVEHAVVVLNTNKLDKSSANINQLREHFSPHVRAVHVIPFDYHLAEGAEINLDLLNKKTVRAFEKLAEVIAIDFPSATGKHTKEV